MKAAFFPIRLIAPDRVLGSSVYLVPGGTFKN